MDGTLFEPHPSKAPQSHGPCLCQIYNCMYVYTYITYIMLIKTFRFMTPQAVMDAVFGTFVGTLKFLQLSISLRINFLGLLVSAFLIGFLTGVICCAYLILWTYGFRLPSPFAERPSSQPAQRLVRYLNEHSNLLSRGR